jgi:hypothetical protein
MHLPKILNRIWLALWRRPLLFEPILLGQEKPEIQIDRAARYVPPIPDWVVEIMDGHKSVSDFVDVLFGFVQEKYELAA